MLRSPKTVAPRDIIDATAHYFRISPSAILSVHQDKGLSRARHIAMWICRTHLFLSLPELGRAFCRDHTTVLFNVRKIGAQLDAGDVFLRRDVDAIESVIPW
jgi:chromosomal replication initiator protein